MTESTSRSVWEAMHGPFMKWPDLLCSICRLAPLEPYVDVFESHASLGARQGSESWDGWKYGYFHGILRCSRTPCGNTHAVMGEWSEQAEDVVSSDVAPDPLIAGYSVRHILPPLPLMDLPDGAPSELENSLILVSATLLSDTNAAANRMRAVVEQLLDYLRVQKFPPGRRAEKYRLTTHARILALQANNVEAAEWLMAIKWIGNAGSHEGKALTIANVLDGVEFLTCAIRLIFDKKDVLLRRKAARVIKLKGPDGK